MLGNLIDRWVRNTWCFMWMLKVAGSKVTTNLKPAGAVSQRDAISGDNERFVKLIGS